MAEREVDHLLIGGGIASANCARWLREAGGDGSILLVGREPDPPYNRPPLSKRYLSGKEDKAASFFRPDQFWVEHRIELLIRTSVMKLDAEAKVATLSNGDSVKFGTALLATGANVRRLRVPGAVLDGIHYLRAYGNSDGIRDEVERFGRRVVCVGGSYIGCEVAATLREFGCECAIVMLEELPLERGFGQEVGGWARQLLTDHGVVVHGGEALDRFEGEGGGEGDEPGRVTKVVTKSGLELPADLVVIGAGVMPDVMLARQAGLAIGERGGVLCDAKLATSAPGIYAAGDVCEYESAMHGGGHVRVEHWDVAFNHGKTVALNMLGRPTDHTVVPYFWSDLDDWAEIESVGPAYEWDEVVIRGSLDAGEFSAWYIGDGLVKQTMAVNRSSDLDVARALIAGRTPIGDRLTEIADAGSDLTLLTA